MRAVKDILLQIKESVHATDPQATLILYGSYARGDYNEDSDIDILVLLDKEKITMDDRTRINYPLYHIGMEADIHISPKLRTKERWNTFLNVTPFYKNVTREGVVL